MNTKLIKCLLTVGCSLLAACAIITVNVYFPEKAVKDAYKSVDDMLLKGGGEKGPAGEQKPGDVPNVQDGKPLSGLFHKIAGISLVSEAYAADNIADDLAVELAGMPEVAKAYDDMSRQLTRVNALLDSGAIGLTSQGLVSVRDKTKVSAQDETLVKVENESRKTVINGMAKAILKMDKKKESREALNQLMGKAAATYAEIKREAAQPGWWTQLPNGRWVQK
jgi:uncharacterized protein